MKVIGFNLTKISVSKKEVAPTDFKIKSNIEIKDLIKDKIDISKQEILKLKFGFTVDYDPDLAKIELDGYIVIVPESDELKKIMKFWKDKKLPDNIRIPLFNFIMTKCNVKALMLEDEMGLPFHVPMPKLGPKNKE